jgi:hypothetical protein
MGFFGVRCHAGIQETARLNTLTPGIFHTRLSWLDLEAFKTRGCKLVNFECAEFQSATIKSGEETQKLAEVGFECYVTSMTLSSLRVSSSKDGS